MTKSLIGAVLLFCIGITSVYAMDLIILKDGSTIESRVIEISPTEIRYRRINHLDGPIIVVPAANVLSIRYQNGRVDIISAPVNTAPAAIATQNNQSDNLQAGGASAVPQLGQPSLLQQQLNLLPAIPVAGNNLKFEFGGDTWIAKRNGRNFLAGSFSSEDTEEGNVKIILKQTHTYPPRDIPRINWVRTPGPELILEYTPGPPASLRYVGRSQGSTETAEGRSRSNTRAARTEGESDTDTADPDTLFPKNSLTGEYSFLGAGINYERNLTNSSSLGCTVFGNVSYNWAFGILVTSRLYLGDSPLYSGLGLGWGTILGIAIYDGYDDYGRYYYYDEWTAVGFMMNPVVGMKFGRWTKGLVVDISLGYPVVFGKKSWRNLSGGPDGYVSGSHLKLAIGIGGNW